MPSKSKAQHALMAMASTARGRMKLKADGMKMPPQSVALEFRHADKGKRFHQKHVREK